MPVLSDSELTAALGSLPGWERADNAITRRFQFADFLGSVMFVNRITGAAEAADHHPDLAISWNTVDVSLSTHSQGGVTEKDIAMAGQIDALAA